MARERSKAARVSARTRARGARIGRSIHNGTVSSGSIRRSASWRSGRKTGICRPGAGGWAAPTVPHPRSRSALSRCAGTHPVGESRPQRTPRCHPPSSPRRRRRTPWRPQQSQRPRWQRLPPWSRSRQQRTHRQRAQGNQERQRLQQLRLTQRQPSSCRNPDRESRPALFSRREAVAGEQEFLRLRCLLARWLR